MYVFIYIYVSYNLVYIFKDKKKYLKNQIFNNIIPDLFRVNVLPQMFHEHFLECPQPVLDLQTLL